jgi:hypothetical protein
VVAQDHQDVICALHLGLMLDPGISRPGPAGRHAAFLCILYEYSAGEVVRLAGKGAALSLQFLINDRIITALTSAFSAFVAR